MKMIALKRVGPPPALTSSLEARPTWRNISIIGIAVGNIIAIIPSVQEIAKINRSMGTIGNEGMLIIGAIPEKLSHQARSVISKMPAVTARISSDHRKSLGVAGRSP